MLDLAVGEYANRMPQNYPRVIDEVDRGTLGLMLDPSHSLHFVSDGTNLYVELMARSSRADARSSASRQKYAGLPYNDRRLVPADVSDQELRNYIGELVARWNMLPRIIHITDT